MDHKYPASYLSADDFYKTFKVFKDHLNEQGPSLFLSALKDQDFGKKESFKWLSIGSGYGDMELKILKMMKESNMKLVVESLECYEPGNVQFKHLQEVKFDDLQTPPMLRNEALLPSTDLGQANQYDVITMFHVHYYWTTPDERIQIMSKLFDHLSPGGILFILILEKGADNQIAMRRFTKDMLVFDEPRDYQSVTVYGSDLANEELAPILESKVVEAKLLHKYQVSVDLDLSQIDDAAASVTSDLLSYVSSVDFNPLPIEVKKAVLEWVAKHCQHKQDQVYQMQQAACALMYTKNN